MKKLASFIIISLILIVPFFILPIENVEAAPCTKYPTSVNNSGDINGDNIVTPDCTSASGWLSVLSGARYQRTTSSGTNIYHANIRGYSSACSDFNRVYPNGEITPYLKPDGSITYVRNTPQGVVRLYRAHSDKNPPTLWHGADKIRY